ncbi:pyridoxal phosphate-dependent transferase [Mycotypha africana]|uniref:pyridoxal phosphate-dependent transferase n=1 Tax=Mycotypha africana TaxID=64632 RepID=UPI002300A85E|nr:pyridoxal phosphate-dependent transferase [Mycotypha africana]KAI8969292.1 pyridoxal phosphate-dependent transferase [Mycotypha africana]
MGKGERSYSFNSLSFSETLVEHGVISPSRLDSLPTILDDTIATAKKVETVGRLHLSNKPACRWKIGHSKDALGSVHNKLEKAPTLLSIVTYLNILTLTILGHFRDFFGKLFKADEYAHLRYHEGYAPLVSDFDSFYTRRMYMRIRLTGKSTKNLNLSSYNYLGFAQNTGPCADIVEKNVRLQGITSCSPRAEAGTTELHRELERTVARFVGKEDAMVVSMGFATNSTTIPALVGKDCLIISDELNHSSIIFGARLSGASVRTFKHNDMENLEELLKEVISQGRPTDHARWKKILLIVEGLYSMEGTIVNLPALIQLKKKYKFYLYVDEAHSIGALGDVGGGVCNFWGVDPANVDILMGTFTKSFGSAGGYIAGDKAIINHLRVQNHAYLYAESMSVPVTQQVITSMKIIAGEDGTKEGKRRIERLKNNSLYFSKRLKHMGLIVYGDTGSPVIPLLLIQPAKIPSFSREMLKRGIAVVVVGYPATPIDEARARFCISASHTKEDLDYALQAISEISDKISLRVRKETPYIDDELSYS